MTLFGCLIVTVSVTRSVRKRRRGIKVGPGEVQRPAEALHLISPAELELTSLAPNQLGSIKKTWLMNNGRLLSPLVLIPFPLA